MNRHGLKQKHKFLYKLLRDLSDMVRADPDNLFLVKKRSFVEAKWLWVGKQLKVGQ